MRHATSEMKLQVVGALLALVLIAPAAAHATSTGSEGRARGGQHAAFSGGTIVVDSEQARVRHADGAAGREVQPRPGEAVRRPDLGWPDAVVGIGFMIGVLCLVLWIDAVVGALEGAATVFGRGAVLVTRRLRPLPPRASEPVTKRELSSTE